jgi:hypothetical protein
MIREIEFKGEKIYSVSGYFWVLFKDKVCPFKAEITYGGDYVFDRGELKPIGINDSRIISVAPVAPNIEFEKKLLERDHKEINERFESIKRREKELNN